MDSLEDNFLYALMGHSHLMLYSYITLRLRPGRLFFSSSILLHHFAFLRCSELNLDSLLFFYYNTKVYSIIITCINQ